MKPLTLPEVVALPVGAIVRWTFDGREYRAVKVGHDTWCDAGKFDPEMDDESIATSPPAFLVLADPSAVGELVAAAQAFVAHIDADWNLSDGDRERLGDLLGAIAKATGKGQ